MEIRVVIVLMIVAGCGYSTAVKVVTRRDTYLTAYLESHGPAGMPPGEVHPGEYGPPTAPAASPGYSYGPPPVEAEPAAEPHANPLDPIHAKIVLLFKVLLKLLIFKLIVKFIAIICVFLFLPKLSELGVAKEDSSTRKDEKGRDDQIQMTQFITDAISGKHELCSRKDTPLCRLRRAMDDLDSRFSIPRLLRMYIAEEKTTSRHKQTSKKLKRL